MAFRVAPGLCSNRDIKYFTLGGPLLEAEKILITGATGKIAFPIARALAAAGNEVWGVARLKDPAARETRRRRCQTCRAGRRRGRLLRSP